MEATKLLYLQNFTLRECLAKVVSVTTEDDRTVVILDQTIFYPQGGGQPFDQGALIGTAAKFAVAEVRFVDGLVKHIGNFERGTLAAGDTVSCQIDAARRELNSRLHSAGHVVDLAVAAVGLPWVPGKGYHFPDGPYVEYAANLEGLDREKLRTDIETKANAIIAEGRSTTLKFMPKEDMAKVCRFVPDYIPEGKPGRVVMYGDDGIPCGGTHVSNLAEIRSMTIRKIKPNGAAIRVSYDVGR